jgi:hypothetical protein
MWAERLPDLAIWERRRALDARKYEPAVPAPVAASAAPVVARTMTFGPPRRREVSPLREATKNAAILTLGALGLGFALSRIPHKGRQTSR